VTRRALALALLLAHPAVVSAQMGPVPPPPMAATLEMKVVPVIETKPKPAKIAPPLQ